MKRIVIDMGSRTEQHLLSGNSFTIDRRLERRGGYIYLDRNYTRHPTISGVRSILLPDRHLWVMFFEGHGAPHPCRCYMHMARILDGGDLVTVEDLYLDVLVLQDGRWQVVDIDEFREALARGELTTEQTQAALSGLENACQLVETAGAEIEPYLKRLLNREGA
jgi:predicted RNA-binding protein associated with RNAse of E/G family